MFLKLCDALFFAARMGKLKNLCFTIITFVYF